MDMQANSNWKQSLRMRRALLLSSVVLAAVSLFWAMYFALHGNWAVCFMNLISTTIAATTALLTLRGHTRAAAVVIFCAVYIVLCIVSVLLDVPTPQAPRSTHNYFLVIALFASLVFRNDHPWLRHGLSAAALLAFIFFASNSWGLNTGYQWDQRCG